MRLSVLGGSVVLALPAAFAGCALVLGDFDNGGSSRTTSTTSSGAAGGTCAPTSSAGGSGGCGDAGSGGKSTCPSGQTL